MSKHTCKQTLVEASAKLPWQTILLEGQLSRNTSNCMFFYIFLRDQFFREQYWYPQKMRKASIPRSLETRCPTLLSDIPSCEYKKSITILQTLGQANKEGPLWCANQGVREHSCRGSYHQSKVISDLVHVIIWWSECIQGVPKMY